MLAHVCGVLRLSVAGFGTAATHAVALRKLQGWAIIVAGLTNSSNMSVHTAGNDDNIAESASELLHGIGLQAGIDTPKLAPHAAVTTPGPVRAFLSLAAICK